MYQQVLLEYAYFWAFGSKRFTITFPLEVPDDSSSDDDEEMPDV